MKPSERILEINKKVLKMEGMSADSLIEATIIYLDEQYEKKCLEEKEAQEAAERQEYYRQHRYGGAA